MAYVLKAMILAVLSLLMAPGAYGQNNPSGPNDAPGRNKGYSHNHTTSNATMYLSIVPTSTIELTSKSKTDSTSESSTEKTSSTELTTESTTVDQSTTTLETSREKSQSKVEREKTRTKLLTPTLTVYGKTSLRTISASPPTVTMAMSSIISSDQSAAKEDLELKLDRPFHADLKNKNSVMYKNLEKEVVENLTKVLERLVEFLRVVLRGCKEGSIYVSTTVFMRSASSGRVRSTLDYAHRNGELVTLGVTEIRYIEVKSEGGEDTSNFVHILIAVGVVAGVALCIFIVIKLKGKPKTPPKKAKKQQHELDEISSTVTQTTKDV